MIENMFSVDLYRGHIDLKLDETLIKELQEEITGKNYSIDDGGASSSPDQLRYQKDKRIKSLNNEIKNHVRNGWLELGMRKDLLPFIRDMWMNVIYPKGSMKDQAKNSQYAVFGIYHLLAEENSGDILIEHPLRNMMNNHPYEPHDNLHRYKVKVKTGDLILFPSTFLYSTTENKSQSNRITLEFGCNFQFDIHSFLIDRRLP